MSTHDSDKFDRLNFFESYLKIPLKSMLMSLPLTPNKTLNNNHVF